MIFDDWKEKSKELKPDKRLLWDVDQSKLDFHRMKKLYVQRVIERGGWEDFYAAIRFYGGIEKFVTIIKEVHNLSDRNIDIVCMVFNIKREESKMLQTEAVEKETFRLLRNLVNDDKLIDFVLVGGTALAPLLI